MCDLAAEVARLRAVLQRHADAERGYLSALAAERAAHEATKAEAERNSAHWDQLHVAMLDLAESNAADAYRAEARVAELTAAHEATKEENEALVRGNRTACAAMLAAEARVAELERLLEQERAEVEMKQAALDGSTRIWRDQKTALDQARGLLAQCCAVMGPRAMTDAVQEWLRAHPAPKSAPAARRLQEKLRQLPELMAHTPIPVAPYQCRGCGSMTCLPGGRCSGCGGGR